MKGPSTYLHAGAGSKGWPHDQKAEDTSNHPGCEIEVPAGPQYRAEFTYSGGVTLILFERTKKHIANFNNFADAQTAAKALNELKGY